MGVVFFFFCVLKKWLGGGGGLDEWGPTNPSFFLDFFYLFYLDKSP